MIAIPRTVSADVASRRYQPASDWDEEPTLVTRTLTMSEQQTLDRLDVEESREAETVIIQAVAPTGDVEDGWSL